MPAAVAFVVILVGSIATALWRRWPWIYAGLDGVSSATVVMVAVFGEQLPIPYSVKALLIALGAGLWVWVEMTGPRAAARRSEA